MEGRRWGGGVRGKVEVMYELLATQPWQSMPLQVRYAEEYGWGVHEMVMKRSEREKKDWEKARGKLADDDERRVERMKRHIYALPTHMPLTLGPFDQLEMYAYRRLRRERRKGRTEAGEVANVTPGEYGENELDDGVDDERMESGEESNNSGESDVEIIEQADGKDDDDDWTGFSLTQPAAQHINITASSSSSRPQSSSPTLPSALSAQLRCGLCFRRSEVGEGGHGGFLSGCDQCRFVGHLTCIVQHIFKQMQTAGSPTHTQHDADCVLTQPNGLQPPAASTLSPPTRFASNPIGLFSPSPAFPPTMFSSLPPSLPLLPPLSTGTCPTCNARLSYPLLIERCRYMHEGKDGRRGGDVWYEEADELSISTMVREYAGRAGELRAKEKEEEASRKKADGGEKRKRTVKSRAEATTGGDETSSAEDAAASPKRKRKSTKPKKKRAEAVAVSPPNLSRSRSPPPPIALAFDRERDKENVTASGKTAEANGKKRPTASRRVSVHDKAGAPALLTSSQPAPAVAVASSSAPVRMPVSLSDDDDVLLVDEVPSADKRRRLMAEAAERRLGRSAAVESRVSAQPTAVATDSVSLLDVKGAGGLHGSESLLDVAVSRDYVHVDDDSDVLALDTETEAEDEVSEQSLSERLRARAEAAQLVASLHKIR